MENKIFLSCLTVNGVHTETKTNQRNFWKNLPRNKLKVILIFDFLGLEMINFMCLNKSIFQCFKNELRTVKRIDEYSKNLLEFFKDFKNFITEDNSLIFSININCNKSIHIVNEEIVKNRYLAINKGNEILDSKSSLFKFVILRNIYNKYKNDFEKGVFFNSHKLNTNTLKYAFNLFIDIQYYFNNRSAFNCINFSECSLSVDHLNSVKSYIDKICSFAKNPKLCLKFIKINLTDEEDYKNKSTSFKKFYELIFSFLNSCSKINALVLNSNFFLDSSIENLSNILTENNTLEELDISNNYLNTNSHQILFSRLIHNKYLKILKVRGCNIGNQSYLYLTSYLKENSTLVEIDIAENFLVNNSIIDILNIMSDNFSCKKLCLEKNLSDSNICDNFLQMITVNSSILLITIDWYDEFEKLFINQGNKNKCVISKICRIIDFLGKPLIELKCDKHKNNETSETNRLECLNSTEYISFKEENYQDINNIK